MIEQKHGFRVIKGSETKNTDVITEETAIDYIQRLADNAQERALATEVPSLPQGERNIFQRSWDITTGIEQRHKNALAEKKRLNQRAEHLRKVANLALESSDLSAVAQEISDEAIHLFRIAVGPSGIITHPIRNLARGYFSDALDALDIVRHLDPDLADSTAEQSADLIEWALRTTS